MTKPSRPNMPSANIARQRRFWTRQAASWDHGADNNPGLVKIIEKVLEEAHLDPDMRAMDLGCGSGQLTFRVAPHVQSVLAIDISEKMIELLLTNASTRGISNVEGQAEPIEYLELAPESFDLVVSNYALHHLRDHDKQVAVNRAAQWLRPGGRLVIGDMMFGRGLATRDREIISSKLQIMLRRGPAGWWRIAKNAVRFLFRYQERPVSIDTWTKYFQQAGLEDVEGFQVVQEGAVVRGVKPSQ